MPSKPGPTSQPQRLLFLNFNKLGDALLQTQIFHSLKESSPHYFIAVFCCKIAHEILDTNRRIDYLEMSTLQPERSFSDFVQCLMGVKKIVREQKIDTIVCDRLNSNSYTALIMHLAGVRFKFYSAPIRHGYQSLLLSGVSRPAENLNADSAIRDFNLDLVKRLGGRALKTVEMFLNSTESRYGVEVTSKIRQESSLPLVALAPFSRQQATAWPLKNIRDFVTEGQKKFQIVLLGTADEVKSLGELSSFKGLFTIDRPGVKNVFSVIKNCDALVTLDSGPSHFLEAMSIPVIKLNSDRIPSHTWGYDGNPRYHFIQVKQPCGPCHSPKCRFEDHPCMTQLTPQMALSKLLKVLGSVSRSESL